MAIPFLALADDLTGALEAGAQLAMRGVPAVVSTRVPRSDPGRALVIDTETRHLQPGDARERVRRVLEAALPFCTAVLYKKTDSTLRGNIGAELAGMRDAAGGRDIVYVPAYPEMGRTVRGGRLLVDGVPVHETAFARDPLNPVRSSDVADVLCGVTAEIVDAETAEDIGEAARRIAATQPRPIAAGPANLAGALADALQLPRQPVSAPPRVRTALVVNGSLHPASIEQARRAGEISGWRLFDGSLEDAAAEFDRIPADALIVFGGDTAFAIHAALGEADFEPLGEIVPGVPASICDGRLWITKAGGFGRPDILCDIQRRLA